MGRAFAIVPDRSSFPCRLHRIRPLACTGLLCSLRMEVYGSSAVTEFSSGPFSWTDYSVDLQLMSWIGSVGVAFRVMDPMNYYEFKLFHGQLSQTHRTPGLLASTSGPALVAGSSCTVVGSTSQAQCVLDDLAGTSITFNSGATPTVTVDFQMVMVVTALTTKFTTTDLQNAQARSPLHLRVFFLGRPVV
jgi:hypothetical protein